MLKRAAKSILKKSGVFPVARLIYRRVNPTIASLRRREIRMYQELLKPDCLCFDIGANLGQKSDIFLNAGFRSIVVEPNRFCEESLRLQFANNPRATIVQKAVGSTPGEMTLYADGSDAAASLLPEWNKTLYGNSRQIGTQTVSVTTLDELIAEFGSPDYIKIDVEGFENEVLLGLSKPVPLISFEFHSREIQMVVACIGAISRFGTPTLRASDMYGHWLCSPTSDVDEMLEFIRRTKAKGDMYVWMSSA
jgi:FkbM family methyltransferase